MELWVRSQDKMLLRKPEQLIIYEGNEVWFIGESLLIDYGTYKTKERALEVLDEIQEAQLGKYHYRCPSDVKVSNNENTIVFEMPQE